MTKISKHVLEVWNITYIKFLPRFVFLVKILFIHHRQNCIVNWMRIVITEPSMKSNNHSLSKVNQEQGNQHYYRIGCVDGREWVPVHVQRMNLYFGMLWVVHVKVSILTVCYDDS